MRKIRALFLRALSLFKKTRQEQEMSDEFESHLQMHVEDNLRAGMVPVEARRHALIKLGGLDQTKENYRDRRRLPMLETLLQDIRYGLRMLGKNPGFTAVAVLTLALGIGANTAIFNILDAVLFRSLPVEAPRQLVLLTDPDAHGRSYGSESGFRSLMTYAIFEYLRDHDNVFSEMFAADSQLPRIPVSLGGSASDSSAPGETAGIRLVSGGYFSTLGIKAAAGRMFTTEVDRARGAYPIAVISYSFWKDRFGLDPSILGKSIRIRETPFEIVGITEPGFFGETVGESCDIWVPMTMQEAIYPGRDLLSPGPPLGNQFVWLQAMARLKPGITMKQANAGIDVVFKQYLESSLGSDGTPKERRDYFNQQIELQQGARGISTVHHYFADPLKVLMALVVLVLFIACANVANLQLARGTARRREFAVRMAIGAGRFRLVRQLLVESLLLAFLGAAVSVLLAQWTIGLLLRMVSRASFESGVIQISLRPDARVLGFTLAVAVLTAILFGLIPALHATRQEVSATLKSPTGLAGEGVGGFSAGKVLVIAQVAVSLILLVVAGLFVHSLSKLGEVSLGYNRENMLVFRVDSALAGEKGPEVIRFYQDLLAKFSAIPGVRVPSLSSNGLFQDSDSGDPIEVEGYTANENEEMHVRMDHVGPGYFSAVGIPLLIGREIGVQDSGNGPRAAVINQAFAGKYFPHLNPIGKHVRDTFPGNPGEAEIVGVVADSKINSLREQNRPRIYFPLFNPVWEHTAAVFEIRTYGEPSTLSGALRKTLGDTNAHLLPVKIETLSSLVDHSLGNDRFIMLLASAFGSLALLLAGVGLYGVMAYTIARKTRDIGIRMALGAQPAKILRDVVRETLALVVLGIAVGAPIALGGTRLIKSLLFGLGSVDPSVLALAAALMVLVAVLAGLLPARRAARVDPMVALRSE
ncbi:MAG TPA: ABC transporter permease [Terriglobia bacterium]|nr:ABC transporter permease [Terriglobia bacterium]